MIIEIDFNSDEALYMQLRNQIILGIATNRFHEGDVLPSVRQLAVIAVDEGKKQAMLETREDMRVLLAKASCKNISREEVHALIDEIYEEYGGLE